MASVRSHAQDMSMSLDEPVETSPERGCDPSCTQDHDGTERESLSQPSVNFPTDTTSSEEYSQAPTGQVVSSQQPSPEFLMSLGVKVRDFAYENTLPAIVPVPRVPRQVQPTPQASKRAQRDWEDEGPLSPTQLLSRQTGPKKPRPLERKPTEPLPEPVVQHTRTLERIRVVRRLCSIIAPPPRTGLPTPPHARISAGLSPLAPQESELVQPPSTFPFAVRVDDTSMIPAPQLDSTSQPLSFHPVLCTHFALDSRSLAGCSPTPSLPQNGSPISPPPELPFPIEESGMDPPVHKRRGRMIVDTTAPSNRYQLRQRPIPPTRALSLSRCSHQASSSTSKSRRGRTRRVR